ncbi:MAG TPA: prepilin-type N-terminal cleavage/methylation domain-containing protein [Geobacteraceae bacterium]|nr:prepilin-type N-terminal cleavage/methylation domain-containing protein [Geobacteraceae bacterium]
MPSKCRGFTLLEFLVAILILSVGLLGMMQAVNNAIGYNMTTQLRDEAVRLADEKMAREKAKPFDAISTTTKRERVKVTMVNAFQNYSVVRKGSIITSSTKSIQIDVFWRYKGKKYGHVISSLVSESVF